MTDDDKLIRWHGTRNEVRRVNEQKKKTNETYAMRITEEGEMISKKKEETRGMRGELSDTHRQK